MSLLFVVFHITSVWAAKQELTFYTEEYPPYNYQENGELRGIAVELLIAANSNIGREIERENIKLRPWPRAYRAARSQLNAVLFSTARTEMREALFKWAGPIGQTRIVLLAKKSAGVRIEHPSHISRYSVGVIMDDVGEQLSLKAGVPASQIQRANNAKSLAKMLNLGRIDVWAYEEYVARWILRKIGLDSNDFEVVYVLNELEMFFAFHPETEQTIVDEMQRGISMTQKVDSKTGLSQYQEIINRYLNQ
ncbi:transporter substrate-binding domain-containing protein [Vibrio sp. SCSIO 43136]|uniref:substrate-binding periplasmic protein n=1 Tax=Vibrio sp. SCSIO 43136 TaxID=2819101 RepID=UPI002074E1A9|nr:transporter substrate-binding domain-containing protein [Vibrio sp. SCSIO 43136]USD66932.1 transporter substrate-binding domain-containing protein [Vibrio sp. SCSIO 43136]